MPAAPDLHVLAVTHATHALDVRERLSLHADGLAVRACSAHPPADGAMVVATCHRVELYWLGRTDLTPVFVAHAEAAGVELDPDTFLRRDGPAAVRHLFGVTAGMQSLALGETEIQGQVRHGWELAEARGTASPELGRVVDAALHAGKRVRRALGVFDDAAEDGRAAGGPSLAEAAVLAELGRHRGTPTVLVLGAGEAATGALDGLVSRGVTDVTVLNRTLERALALAASRGVSAAAWDRLATYLETADLVVSATAAPDAILGRDLLAQVAARRQGRPLTLLDIAVPRDVDPAARELPGLRLVDLDDLRREGLVARASRATDIPSGEAQLEREVARFLDQARSRASAGALSSLHQLGARIADEETARALEALDGLSEEDQAVVRALAQRVVKRLLYPASKELRGAESRPRNVELSA